MPHNERPHDDLGVWELADLLVHLSSNPMKIMHRNGQANFLDKAHETDESE